MVNLVRRFRSEQTGVTLIEGLISLPIMMIALIALVELGWGLFQWGQAAKAVQYGARMLAVSDPLLPDLDTFSGDFGGLIEGDPVPSTVVSVSCGGGTTPCVTTGMNRLVYGGDGACAGATGTARIGMCDLMPRIAPENVRVTYTRDGLGYVGRPSGPVLSIRVELVNLSFTFLLLGSLFGANTLVFPPHPVIITSEDMSSCRDECS